ncbi:MAG: PAS domain S-box protein, partial [Aeoliella sp.]
DALGWGWLEAVHPEDRTRVSALWEKTIAEGIDYEVELRYRMADGHYRWHLARARKFTGLDGQTDYWFGVSAEVELENSSRQEVQFKAQAVLDTAVDGIITIDERGIVESLNPAATRMFGYAEQEVLGNNVNMLMPESMADEHDSYIANYLRSGEKKIIGIGREVEGRRKDGSLFPLELAVSEVVIDQRRFFTGVVHDITARKAANEAFEREHEFNELIIETTPNIVLVLDTSGNIVRFNRYLELLSGKRLEDVKGKAWFDTFLPERDHERIRQLFATAVGGAPTRGHVNPIMTADGKELEIEWYDAPLHDHSGALVGLLCAGVDITELKSARSELAKSERLAAVGQMLSATAHESRNALQRIKAGIDLLKLDSDHGAAIVDDLAAIEKASDDLTKLFENLRSYAGALRLQLAHCDLREICDRAWSSLSVHRRGTDATLEIRGDCSDTQIEADDFRIEQVVRNLFENALDAAQGAAQINVSIGETQLGQNRALCMSVEDNGPGIADEEVSRVFEAFFSTKRRGSGLGMAIAKRIVEEHHGTVAAEGHSATGGALFRITLPVRQP